MTDATPLPKFRFPRLRRARLESFSIYTQESDVDIATPPGVACVAGANGVGKSTFLSAVNFAITGVVPVPGRPYRSSAEYVDEARRYTDGFFDGRIQEADREGAAVSVEFTVGDDRFEVTRGVFDGDALRAFRVLGMRRGRDAVAFDGAALAPEARRKEYERLLTKAVGVQSFHQLTFLQHFVLTFDEGRHLLFWSGKALQDTLFLTFGGEPKDAARATDLRRQMERADSLGRNKRFAAVGVKKRLDEVRRLLESDEPDETAEELVARYEVLSTARDQAADDAEAARTRLGDADLALADASAALIAARAAYGTAFARHVGDHSFVAQHPVVLAATAEARCGVCGSEGRRVSATVRRRLRSDACPLCETVLHANPDGAPDLEALRALDAEIARARERLEASDAARVRLSAASDDARRRAAAADADVREFERAHGGAVERARARDAVGGGAAAIEADRLRAEYQTLLEESRDLYAKRDGKKREFQKLQRSLNTRYAAAEADFVPLFRSLAERFLGIELDVVLDEKKSDVALVLELRNSVRREEHQLSESQRFFLDIALRMALAQFASDPHSRAALFVDTPEGSLDIAYESRAGEMFARFAESGHDLLMTANVNTSQLLLKLARECGRDRMRLIRMTDWANLSDVQLAEEALFREAYLRIEEALDGVPAGAPGRGTTARRRTRART